MSNRFKFRVWNIEDKKFINGQMDSIYKDWPLSIYLCDDGRLCQECPYDHPTGLSENYVIQQCTGLKDYEGKLIYEGDIISDGSWTEKVYYDEEQLQWRTTTHNLCDINMKNMTIIGNVLESPKLLDG